MLGALLPLAFAPFYLWPLAIVNPVLLLWLLQTETSLRKQFIAGWWFGVGYFGFGLYWIYNSLHDFGMAPPAVATAITALLVVYLAIYIGLIQACWKYAERRFGAASLWLVPTLWFGFEWFKGWLLTGMPWLSLGYAHTHSPLAGFAPLVGVYGIGALGVLAGIALLLVLRDRRWPWLGLVLIIPLSGWLLQQHDWTRPLDRSLDVTMVQGNIPQEIKWRYDQRQNILNTYWRETEDHWNSDLIIWPETALPGQSEEIETSVLQPIRDQAIAQDTDLLSGLIVSEGEILYNSVIQLGTERRVYHKRHLVIFGEYYPMRWLLNLLSGVISIPYSDLTPGPRDQALMRVDGLALGVSICFEDVFSRAILLALPEANLLVNVTNDAWFGDSTAPHQHKQIAQMRALETERAMLRATNTGVSAFIDYKGRVQAATGQFTTESIRHRVEGREGLTPFYYFGKIQGLLALLPIAGIFIMGRRKARG